jgi:hypothetical protein
MARNILLLFIGLIIIACDRVPKTQPKIPEGWNQIKADRFFTFYLPGSMKLVIAAGSPESEWGSTYSNDQMTLGAEYGSWGGEMAADYLAKQAEYQKVITTIDGKTAKIQSWRLEEANWNHDYKHTAHLLLYNPHNGKRMAEMTVLCYQSSEIETAKQIFNTIQFQ